MNTHYRLPDHANLMMLRLITAVVILIALYLALQPAVMKSLAALNNGSVSEWQPGSQPRPVPVPTPPQSQQSAALPLASTPTPEVSQPQPVPQPVPTPPLNHK